MAKKHTIIEQIRLDGGADIEKEFHAIGDAGVKAFNELKQAANSLGKTSELTQFLNRLGKDFDHIQRQAKVTGAAYRELGGDVLRFGRNVAALSGVLVGAVVGLVAITKGAADAADAQNKAAQSAGLAQEQYAQLQFVFEQSDVDAQSFGTAMKKLNQNIVAAKKGTGDAADAFASLGVRITGANGKLLPTDQILQQIAARFAKLPDGAEKSALAVKLFGKAGAAMIPALNDGKAAMVELQAQAERLGLTFTKQEAVIGDKFGDALNALGRQATATSQHLALLFAPSLTETFDTLSKVISDNKAQLTAFATTLASQVTPLIKDFTALLKGDDDAVVNKNLIVVRDTVISIGQAFGIVANIVNAFFGAIADLIQPFVDIFNEAFGTRFTAQSVVITGILLSLTGGFRIFGSAIKAVGETWKLLVVVFKGAAPLVAAAIAGVLGVIAEIQFAIEGVGNAFKAFPQVVQDALAPLNLLFQTIGQFFVAVWTGATTNVGTLFSDLVHSITASFQGVFDFIKHGIDATLGFIQGLLDAAAQVASAIGDALGGGGAPAEGGGGFAGGGLIKAPGSGTSDSGIVRVSDNEFIVRAAAVRKYGVGFMSALNGMRLPKLRGFATGGLVGGSLGSGALVPSFAGGGAAGRPLSLSIGADIFEGLIAPDTVASKLVNYANGRKARSAGRRPSWSN